MSGYRIALLDHRNHTRQNVMLEILGKILGRRKRELSAELEVDG